MGIRK
jgi:hypothetical protein